MNKKQKGDVTEAKTLSKLVSLGYNPLLPFSENSRYDIAVDEDGELIRLQCKTAWRKDDKVLFNCCDIRHTGGNSGRVGYDSSEIDGFAVLTPDEDLLWIPISDAPNAAMTLRYEPSESKYASRSNIISDYLFEDRF